MKKFGGFAVLAALAWSAQARNVVVRTDGTLPRPAAYGIEKLADSLRARGHSVGATEPGSVALLAGLSSGGAAADALRSLKAELPQGPDALVIRRTTLRGTPTLILCGGDARGLMYAALDAADRVGWTEQGSDPLAHIRDATERPFLAERGMSMYTMQRAYFESRLYDARYWERYFDLLARSRINTFTMIFGYENGGFMAPPYPYFFDTPSHADVRLVGLTREQQEKNRNAFKAMMRIAHERGIDVIAAIWDHIYRGGVQAGGIAGASELAGKEVPGLVSGVTTDNLAAYTKSALRRFMKVFPEVDGLEFRMHTESGLRREEMPAFWHEVFGMLAQAKPGMRVTLRAKDLPDSIIDDALQQGLRARVETKYWMEQMGMPFHPTHVNPQNQHERRHGYADLLRYPQKYRVHWRLWSGGTTRLLLWGDPEYVRRFAASARLYDGNSIDVNEMLATKMLGEPHDKAPLPVLNAKYKYYDYEFERYWHFYQVWGRVTYSPSTPSEVWKREFERRFGRAGRDVMNGLHLASNVLPRVVAAAYRYQLFPTTRGWAEMMRQGDLPAFAGFEGTDIEQFMSPKDAAKAVAAGTDTSKRRPEETSRWFATTADRIFESVKQTEQSRAPVSAELRSTLADLKILGWLSRYYAARLPAAVSYNLYRETKNRSALDDALAAEKKAVAAWEELVHAAADVYSDDLAFGVHRVGFPRHWREELKNLHSGLEGLSEQRRSMAAGEGATTMSRSARPDVQPPSLQLQPPGNARPGEDFAVTARVQDSSGVKSVRLRYRHLTQFEDYETAEMTQDTKTGLFSARIPGSFISLKWDLMYFVETIDTAGNGRNYPDLEIEAPYVVVGVQRDKTASGLRR
jgi:hypothetical protein